MNSIISNKLKTLRKQKGWSQDEVANQLNISQSAYGRIENGASNSWVNHIETICKMYDIQPEELMNSENNTFHQNNKKGSNNGIVINQISEKLIAQYELRLLEKDKYIESLEKLLEKYRDV